MPRPRSFDHDAVLDAALDTFWRRGYEGAGISDLTDAMGLARPSLYHAFGSKEGLLVAALERYVERFVSGAVDAVSAAGTAEAGVRAFLEGAAVQLSDRSLPPGCFRVGSTAVCRASDAVADVLRRQQADLEAAVADRIRRGQEDGDVPTAEDTEALARFYVGVVNGMAVRARLDPDRRALDQVVRAALRAWPA